MYSYRTYVSGYNTTEPPPTLSEAERDDHTAAIRHSKRFEQWMKQHGKFYGLKGYWRIEKVIGYCRQRGMVGEITVEHVCHDLSGKGRGSRDKRWIVQADDTIVEAHPSREESDDFAMEDAMLAHEAWDEIDRRESDR